jgi:DNA-directed RNA polymerase III subunit RPC8
MSELAHTQLVEFRMLVFRPFRGEILQGRIKSCTEDGIVINMDFTSEVFVPVEGLPANTTFNHAEHVFIWNNEGSELFFDIGEPVLLRVEQEEWTDQKPTMEKKDKETGMVIEERDTSWRLIVCSIINPFRFYDCLADSPLQASMSQPGLGPCLWWGIQEEKPEEGAEENWAAEEEMEE